ncbi:MAG: hypothetical protein AAF376_08990 [Pseudomonadota bacterium]
MASAAEITLTPTAGRAARGFQLYGLFLSAVGSAILVALALLRTGDAFVYTLDDPYIHLAVAESILAGGYGVNVGEFASPSSSILYPYILAGLLALGLGTWAPLAIAVPAMLAAVWLFCGLIWRFGIREDDRAARLFAYAILPLALLAINAYGLPLTGMEHTLHVLAVLMVLSGLVGMVGAVGPVGGGPADTRISTAILVAGLILAPLIRFEGLSVTLAGLLLLLWHRRFLAAAVTSAILVAAFGAYVAQMSSMGLPLLPSSVMVKSDISAGMMDDGMRGRAQDAVQQIIEALVEGRGSLLLAGLVAILAAVWSRPARTDLNIAVAFLATVAIAGHLVAGEYGWFSRYEIYVVALMLAALVVLWGPRLNRSSMSRPVKAVGVTALLAITIIPYATTTLLTPAASENIFLQQQQMHIFATEHFPHPVAVNDLGFVAFDNDGHVLDLWGLGSEEARLRRARPDFGMRDLRELTEGAGTVYAMIYDDWFIGVIPPDWCRIAELQTPRITAASDRVGIYLIDRAREEEMRTALDRFVGILPTGASLRPSDCTTG